MPAVISATRVRNRSPLGLAVIAHFDLDSFFVSVERLRDPSLVGRPVAVGGSAASRGVIASASYEARALGIRSAMPTAQAQRLCPQLVVIPGSHRLYREYSYRFQAILEEYSPLIEMASVDEAYVDFAGTERLWGPAPGVCRIIVARVKRELGLDVSVGLSTSRIVSKIASSRSKPKGFAIIEPGCEAAYLAPLPIEAMPGIGPRTAEAMHAAGIHTLGDLANRTPGDRWADWAPYARGEVRGRVVPEDARKGLSVETTFAHDLAAGEELWTLLRELAEEAGARLRRERMQARTVGVKLKYADFSLQTAAHTLDQATDLDQEIFATALTLAQNRIGKCKLRLIGVHLTNLVTVDEGEQLSLFTANTQATRERLRILNRTLDGLKARYGQGGIRWGYRKK